MSAHILRINHGPGSYDEIIDDLNYVVHDRVLRTSYDSQGSIIEEKEIVLSRPASKHFSLIEPVGNDERLLSDIQRWVKAQSIFVCPNQP